MPFQANPRNNRLNYLVPVLDAFPGNPETRRLPVRPTGVKVVAAVATLAAAVLEGAVVAAAAAEAERMRIITG